jgi:hypothetical protein
MAGRPRKKLTPQDEAARREAIERRQAERELERADREARRQLRRQRKAKPQGEPALQLEPYVIANAHGDPLTVFREGLALARRAGMQWEQAVEPARIVALSVESSEREREQFAAALDATRSAWRAAYEHRPAGFAL